MLSNLASLYELTGNYRKAEAHLREALRITQTAMGEYDPDYAFSLNTLALFYYKRLGRYEAAEPLFRQAVKIYRKLGMEMDPDFANTLNNLAGLYESMSQYAAAPPFTSEPCGS
jgi:tetratricopeptide (TPR) repeat protein